SEFQIASPSSPGWLCLSFGRVVLASLVLPHDRRAVDAGGLGPDRTERLELAARVDIPLRGPPRLPGKSELEHAKTSIAIPDLIPRCGGSSPAAPSGQSVS